MEAKEIIIWNRRIDYRQYVDEFWLHDELTITITDDSWYSVKYPIFAPVKLSNIAINELNIMDWTNEPTLEVMNDLLINFTYDKD